MNSTNDRFFHRSDYNKIMSDYSGALQMLREEHSTDQTCNAQDSLQYSFFDQNGSQGDHTMPIRSRDLNPVSYKPEGLGDFSRQTANNQQVELGRLREI